MNTMFLPNDMLLDQTMLCEASRLLEGCPQGFPYVEYLARQQKGRNRLVEQYEHEIGQWFPSNAERLFNLSMLLDGLALHDHLYVLKAELPLDATHLRLRHVNYKIPCRRTGGSRNCGLTF